LLAFSFRLIEKWQDDEKQKVKLEKEKVSTELSFLKQQINPHFLFNSLNSIYSLSISKSETTPDSILKLSSILRYVLYESEKELVFLHDELQTIKDYIELQKLRLTEMVTVNYKVEGISENKKIEPLLLIPIIENAFKYGVDNIKKSFIDINIKIREGKIELEVSNKIVAIADKNKTDSGIGIKNIKRRLDLLHGNNYEFDIKEENNVFSVRLKLNLKE
jgi:LytS/YehU family sensor histidine kinase